MRKETHPVPTCTICKEPITSEQRPSYRLASGEAVHLECFFREQDKKKEVKPES